MLLSNSLINLIENIYSSNNHAIRANISIRSIAQISKIICLLIAVIASFGAITGSSVKNIFTGIAGLSALLVFLFQDIIKNFVASMQIIFNGLLRIGDWVEFTEKKITGTITQISFTTVQIETTQGYILTLPTQSFISTGIANLRNIVKPWNALLRKNLYFDVKTIKSITEQDFDSLLKNQRIKKYITKTIYRENMTNIEVFRLYIKSYLQAYPGICKESPIIVRSSEQNEESLTIELFASIKESYIKCYDEIESNLHEHFIAIIKEFTISQ